MDPNNRSRGEQSAEVFLLVVVLIWASNYPLGKYAIGGLDIFVYNGIRFLSGLLITLAMFMGRSEWSTVQPGDWQKLVGIGVFTNIIYQLMFIVGLKMTTAGNSAILLSTSPLWTVFFSSRIHHEPLRKYTRLGMALSLVGIALIVTASGKEVELGGRAMIGDLICLLAAILWALNTNFQKSLLGRYSSLQLTLVMTAVGAVAHLLLAIPDARSLPWSSLSPLYYLAAIVSGVLVIGVANVLWSYGVKRIGPSRSANISNLTPVLAFLLSAVTLHEPVSVLQLLGAAVTLSGVWAARL
jgi:drug/metabolite transporter (DMT)-like permease